MSFGQDGNRGGLPYREQVWGLRGTQRYPKIGGDTGVNYYVDAKHGNGNDGNLGTDPEAPFLTIQ
ncbi:unnamed protein product, partial [marine sediment metagenome]